MIAVISMLDRWSAQARGRTDRRVSPHNNWRVAIELSRRSDGWPCLLVRVPEQPDKYSKLPLGVIVTAACIWQSVTGWPERDLPPDIGVRGAVTGHHPQTAAVSIDAKPTLTAVDVNSALWKEGALAQAMNKWPASACWSGAVAAPAVVSVGGSLRLMIFSRQPRQFWSNGTMNG